MITLSNAEPKENESAISATQARVAAACVASYFKPDPQWPGDRKTLKDGIQRILSDKIIDYVARVRVMGSDMLSDPLQAGLTMSIRYGNATDNLGEMISAAIKEAGYDWPLGPNSDIAVGINVGGQVNVLTGKGKATEIYSREGIEKVDSRFELERLKLALRRDDEVTPETAGRPDYIKRTMRTDQVRSGTSSLPPH